MLFAVICRDKPGHLQTRLDARAAHLAYIEKTGIVTMAGPLIEDGADVRLAHRARRREPRGGAGMGSRRPLQGGGLFR